jgi:hypothetical protein
MTISLIFLLFNAFVWITVNIRYNKVVVNALTYDLKLDFLLPVYFLRFLKHSINSKFALNPIFFFVEYQKNG